MCSASDGTHSLLLDQPDPTSNGSGMGRGMAIEH